MARGSRGKGLDLARAEAAIPRTKYQWSALLSLTVTNTVAKTAAAKTQATTAATTHAAAKESMRAFLHTLHKKYMSHMRTTCSNFSCTIPTYLRIAAVFASASLTF
jgi:hypothetical protein